MARVLERRQIHAAADAVWQLAGDFTRAGEWCSGIVSLTSSGSGVGATREVDIGAGTSLLERLERLDPVRRTLAYSVLSGPLPVDDYIAEIEVAEADDGTCIITYSAGYTPARMPAEKCERIFRQAFTRSLDNIERHFRAGRTSTQQRDVNGS